MNYSASWIARKEITNLSFKIDNAPDTRLLPPEQLEIKESKSVIERLKENATTTEERKLVKLIDSLLDQTWRLTTGKALHGELRKLYRETGGSFRQYYKAFYAIKEAYKAGV